MKKILIIAASLKIGGAEKVARDIALKDDSGEFEYHYVVFGDHVGEYEPQLLRRDCRVIHMPEPSESYGAYWRSLRDLMRKERYHAVHAHTMFNCGWVMLAAKFTGIPVRIAHSHSALINGSGLAKTAYETVMRWLILSCATDLVSCGEKAGKRLFGEKAWEKRGKLILNGIDVAQFAYDPEKRCQIRARLGAEDRFLLGHVGHLAQVKNQSFLLELMPLILKKRPDALLLLLGEGDDRPMLEQKIRDMGLENTVVMTGNVPNVSDYLSAMDVFVFPSLFEGTPLSILEVQANGLPCVLSDQVPEDVFLTDLIHPVSLQEQKDTWVDLILNRQRSDPLPYNLQLRGSDYAVETAMGKVYRIYRRIDK